MAGFFLTETLLGAAIFDFSSRSAYVFPRRGGCSPPSRCGRGCFRCPTQSDQIPTNTQTQPGGVVNPPPYKRPSAFGRRGGGSPPYRSGRGCFRCPMQSSKIPANTQTQPGGEVNPVSYWGRKNMLQFPD